MNWPAIQQRLQRFRAFFCLILPILLKTGRRPVLFVRPGAMGDILCTFPAAFELKKRHPHCAFIFSCLPDFACLPRLAGLTPHVTAAYFDPASKWSRCFTKIYHFADNPELSRPSTAVRIEEFCQQYGVAAAPRHPQLQVPQHITARIKTLLATQGVQAGPLILLHPGPSWPVREWPAENWAQLVRQLHQRGFKNILQVGVNKHVQIGQLAPVHIPEVISLVNQLTVEETVALAALSSLVIGIDSGLLHIGASVNIPIVGIFGPTSPQFVIAPNPQNAYAVSSVDCQGCHHRFPRLHWMKGCPHDIRCMTAISIEEVAKLCLEKLAAPTRSA